MSRPAHFCPNCGAPLALQTRDGRERPVCAACGFVYYHDPKVAVLACIIEAERVLLVQRAHDPQAGLWAMPAGFMEHDESPEQAVLREVWEETGLRAEVVRLLAVFGKDANGAADVVIAYACRVVGGQLQAADDAAAAAWFAADAIPPLAFLPSQTLIARWQAGQL